MLQKSLCGASKCSTVLDFEENPATKFVVIDVIRLDKRKIKKERRRRKIGIPKAVRCER